MTDYEYVLETMRRAGRAAAQNVQALSCNMTGTQLNTERDYIPSFVAACKAKNMLHRPAGQKDGFVCRSSGGRVVRLLQHYDSTIYRQEPEELPAQWSFVWSQDPAHAEPFVAISTSPYMRGDCCTDNSRVYRSKIDNNVHAPSAYPQGWEEVV